VHIEPAIEVSSATSPAAPMTWAARVSMPPPAPPAQLRAVSTPIVQSTSWQERFNGLLGKKVPSVPTTAPPVEAVLAVTSATKEPLDVQHVLVPAASVSLPTEIGAALSKDDGSVISKDVESEDDLFEDREPGSLPAIKFPLEASMMPIPKFFASRIVAPAPEVTSMFPFMVVNWFEPRRQQARELYALIRMPGAVKSVRRELPAKGSSPAPTQGGRQRFGSGPPSSSGGFGSNKNSRGRGGLRSRQASSKAL
jgi:hypothetical protein